MRALFFAGLLLGLSICASATSAQTASPAPILIRIGVTADDGVTALLYAREAGLFQSAGLTVDIEKFPSGSTATAAVAGGSLDVAKANSIGLVTAIARGLPFVVLSPVETYRSETPRLGLIVSSSYSLKRPQDFIGKTIAVSALGDLYSLGIHAWLDKNGIETDLVHFVELPQTALLPALDQGRIDGAGVTQPLLHLASTSRKYRVIGKVFDAIAPRFAMAYYFANVNWVSTHRDAAERFIRVMYEANRALGAHENEGLQLLASFMGVDAATIAGIPRPYRPTSLDVADLQPVINVLAKYKTIGKAFPAQDVVSPLALER